MGTRRRIAVLLCTLAALAVLAIAAWPGEAATPPSLTIAPAAGGKAHAEFSGSTKQGAALLSSPDACFGADKKPDPASGCDFLSLDVKTPSGYFDDHRGALQVVVGSFGASDLDLALYTRQPDGTFGEQKAFDGQLPGVEETVAIDEPAGAYYVVVVPYTALGLTQAYKGVIDLTTESRKNAVAINRKAPRGFPNYRASHDKFTAHSETTVAMDPLNRQHLLAGSKMYENNAKYLFKAGSYESFNGGATWKDLGQLPGYCQAPGQCDPANEAAYRTVSDPTIAFDDEGNAYYNVLDAPGGTAASKGFNMTVHIKHPGQPFGGPITLHDNRNNPLTAELLLDDKNWIAVDNETDVNGGSNRPRDGKIGTMYVCWGLDGTEVPGVGLPLPIQQIVIMRSADGGKTWGGSKPGDNLPKAISQKTVVSGIGCHVIIGPKGVVYATWYDNQTNLLMQARSSDRGQSFTPAYPVALIEGVNAPFQGETFRNLSIPTSGIDSKGNLYVAVSSQNGQATPVTARAEELGRKLKSGELEPKDLVELIASNEEEDHDNADLGGERLAGGDGAGPMSGSDIVVFKSTNGGNGWSKAVRVNQDPANGDGDQFQPWMAITPKGQVNISYFDRRDDPDNYFISTYLSRSNDGGKTFHDTRVESQMWDPAVGTPTSVSGQFIGDYQGLAADDEFAYPFWNSTQDNTLPKSNPRFSKYQEAFSARIPNTPASFITGARAAAVLRPLTARQIAALRGRARFAHIYGTATDPSGGKVTGVSVSVRKKVGSRCSFYSTAKRAFVRRSCVKPLYFAASGASKWTAIVPRKALSRGGYAIASKARNDAGSVEHTFERYRNTRAIYVRTPRPKAKVKAPAR